MQAEKLREVIVLRTVNINVGKETKNNRILLGRQGENLVTQIMFDFTGWGFETGTPAVLYMRPDEKLPYEPSITVNGNMAVWNVTRTDTARSGTGTVEVQWWADDAVCKSQTYNATILKSIEEITDIPSVQMLWTDSLVSLVRDAQTSARMAKKSADDAKKDAETAETAYEQISALGYDPSGYATISYVDSTVASVSVEIATDDEVEEYIAEIFD